MEQVEAVAEELLLIPWLRRSLAAHTPKAAGQAAEMGEQAARSSLPHQSISLSLRFA